MTARTAKTLTTLTNLSLMTVLSALVLTGCNRPLPTEPEDSFSSLPTTGAQQTSTNTTSAKGESTVNSPGRSRGARVIPTPAATPTSTPITPPIIPPVTPPTPMITDCDGLCDNILRIPSDGDVDAAIMAARDRVRDAVANREIKANRSVKDWNVRPMVEWKACYFYIANGFYYDADGNRHVGACAAGMTDYNAKKIVISTKNQARTLALVKWEAMNYYLYLIGRNDLLDRWS